MADAGGSRRQRWICEHYVAVSLETPEYDLTILRIRFWRLVLKIYTKGERVLAIWVAGSGRRTSPKRSRPFGGWSTASSRCSTAWTRPSSMRGAARPGFRDRGRLGAVRVGGIDINRPRARAVMQALLALSPNPARLTHVRGARYQGSHGYFKNERYSPSRTAYDLRKFRCNGLAAKIPRSRPLGSPREPHPQLFRDG